jgi:uracil-DNA glycosylase
MHLPLEESWQHALSKELALPYFKNILLFLEQEYSLGKVIYPEPSLIFEAFRYTPWAKVKVVILGQDPYHNPNQAHGLSFSVQRGQRIPPSLKNIYKELNNDLGIPIAAHGYLEHWAQQGVLLLNAALTVEAGNPMSHSKIGWHQFTNAIIQELSSKKDNLIFVLWGNFAQQKRSLIDTQKHSIIESAHPSPLSAHNGFWGSQPFRKINKALCAIGETPIDWHLPT